jgi:hypothetical protein
MTTANKVTIVCVRVIDKPAGVHLPSFVTEEQCELCTASVLICPSSRKVLAAGLGRLLCMPCANKKLAAWGGEVMKLVMSDQLEEARRWFREAAERN